MFHNYLVAAPRDIARHKLRCFITISGLAVGCSIDPCQASFATSPFLHRAGGARAA
jgi:hypothetical protein